MERKAELFYTQNKDKNIIPANLVSQAIQNFNNWMFDKSADYGTYNNLQRFETEGVNGCFIVTCINDIYYLNTELYGELNSINNYDTVVKFLLDISIEKTEHLTFYLNNQNNPQYMTSMGKPLENEIYNNIIY